MRSSHNVMLLFIAVVCFGIASGCETYAPRPDPVQMPAGAPGTGTGEGVSLSGSGGVTTPGAEATGENPIQGFCADLNRAARPGTTLGCLPLVSYDTRHDGPWVTLLGERIADDVASQTALAGAWSMALPTTSMGVRVMDANLTKATLSTIESVARHGIRLGVDTVMFGTIRHDRDVGTHGRSVLSVELNGWDVGARRLVAQRRYEITGDRSENRPAFELVARDSMWQADGKWQVPQEAPTLHGELAVACRVLAQRVREAVDPAKISGAVYLPPADTAAFVRWVARLRAAQAEFAAELGRRTQVAGPGMPIDFSAPVMLNGIQFDNLQEAEDYLSLLNEGLPASQAGRFGKTVTNLLAEELRPKLAPQEVRIEDFGSTVSSDTQLVMGELASGGLAQSKSAREALARAGVAMVVAPRLESVADEIVIRVTAYDVTSGGGRIITTSHVPIPAQFRTDLRRELDVESYGDGLLPVREVIKETSSSWDSTYKNVVSGVARLTGGTASAMASGTGFVVSKQGHIMTNSHVAQAIANEPHAVFENGNREPLELVVDNPFWDVAVFKARQLPAGAHVFAFADAAAARVGTEVAVLGNPKNTQGWVLSPGHLSSIAEEVPTTSGKQRPSYLYTCATREGTSGSPVLLQNGQVVAVNSHGLLGDVMGGSGRAELTGFAFGAPGAEAQKIFDGLDLPASSR